VTLGQRISQYRKNLGISQETLGERLGVSRQAVSKWETGAAAPDMENLLALAREFGVSVAELTATPETPQDTAKPFSLFGFTPVKVRRLVVLLVLVLLLPTLWKLLWSVVSREKADTPDASISAEANPNSVEQTVPVPAPRTDFALLWYGTNGQEEFLELGEREDLFPFGTTLELTEPLESWDTDFSVMTSHLADCGAVTVGYYHIGAAPASDPESPERESIWRLSSIASTVRTPRGVHTGSTKGQVLEAYGDDLVYCRKGDSSYTIAPYDYYYAYQTPETGGAAMLLYMKDGLVSAIQMEHMAEWGSEAYPPDHITRFPLINGEPDFSLRVEQERENISDTRKIYIAWNQLVTNNNLSAEERYAYRQTVFGLLPLIDWDEMRTLGTTDIDPDAGIFGLIGWLARQETYSPSEILWLQMGKLAKGLDGAYAEGYNHVLTQAFFFDPVAFAKNLSDPALNDEERWAVIIGVAYDAPWYEPQYTHSTKTLQTALADGTAFTEAEAGWAKLLYLYLTAEMPDGSFDESLPRTPAELDHWSAAHPDWWNESWETGFPE